MKIACWTLHYGKEYLAWSVRSVQDAVDEIHFFYSPSPSFGFSQGAICPDTEEELHREASRFATKRVYWHRITHSTTEQAHRKVAEDVARQFGANEYVVVDSDEVWDTETLKDCFSHVQHPGRATRWQAHFANFWRSWEYQVDDGFKPIRFVDLAAQTTSGLLMPETVQHWPVFHFGYAQSEAIMRYKWTCHGHQRELRPDWLENKFIPWKPGDTDTHPTVNNLWTPRPSTPAILRKVREIMHDHPYCDLDIIR